MKTSTVKSPITGSTDVQLIEELDNKKIIQGYLKLGLDISHLMADGEPVQIYQCLETGYRFFIPQSLAGDATFYEALQQAYSGYYRADKWEYQKALQYVFPDSRVLDVGCGSGEFVGKAVRKGALAEGLEYNALAVQKGREKGLTIHDSALEVWAENNPESYDVVSSFQVLEHIADVNRFISAKLKLLKPGGKLIIGVPNSNPYIFGFHLYDPLNLPPHHMGLWNRTSLEGLAEVFGLKQIRIMIQPMDEWKNWYLLKQESLRPAHPGLSRIMSWVPRPLYKGMVALISPFLEGRTILAIFQKDE